jgi:hypothetical protein
VIVVVVEQVGEHDDLLADEEMHPRPRALEVCEMCMADARQRGHQESGKY